MVNYLFKQLFWIIKISVVYLALIHSTLANSTAEDEMLSPTASKISKTCTNYKDTLRKPPPISPFTWNHTGLITLWFDDGWVSEFTEALPLMEKYDFKGAVAIAVKFVCYADFMTWDQLHILQSKGWETTAHTISHSCDMAYYTSATIKYELSNSQEIIRAHGLRADQFVMPCGFSREQIISHFVDKYPPIVETSKKYYASYRTTRSERSNVLPLLDPYNLNAMQIGNDTTDKQVQDAISNAVKDKKWLIFIFHQVDDSKRRFAVSPEQFDRILKMVKSSNLPVVLPSQVIGQKTMTKQLK